MTRDYTKPGAFTIVLYVTVLLIVVIFTLIGKCTVFFILLVWKGLRGFVEEIKIIAKALSTYEP